MQGCRHREHKPVVAGTAVQKIGPRATDQGVVSIPRQNNHRSTEPAGVNGVVARASGDGGNFDGGQGDGSSSPAERDSGIGQGDARRDSGLQNHIIIPALSVDRNRARRPARHIEPVGGSATDQLNRLNP